MPAGREKRPTDTDDLDKLLLAAVTRDSHSVQALQEGLPPQAKKARLSYHAAGAAALRMLGYDFTTSPAGLVAIRPAMSLPKAVAALLAVCKAGSRLSRLSTSLLVAIEPRLLLTPLSRLARLF